MKKLTAILTSLIMTLSVICQTSVFAAFSDVGDDNTYKDAITTLTKLKVIDGYEDGTFKPDGQITRAEFTKLIVFILGYKDLAYDSSDFTDVDASHWAKKVSLSRQTLLTLQRKLIQQVTVKVQQEV